MNTFNKGDLKDFTALATGGHIKYKLTLKEKITFGGAVYRIKTNCCVYAKISLRKRRIRVSSYSPYYTSCCQKRPLHILLAQ